MKRLEINTSIELATAVFAQFHLHLPPFAHWTPAEWERAGPECDEIRDCMLGWDVTDFGGGNFDRIGRTLFTLRNGRVGDGSYPKRYAEKVILDPEGQRAPAHFHCSKREDIINRGGGNILVQLAKATPENRESNESFTCQVDGVEIDMQSGGIVRLRPGQSVCIPPRTIHQFWGEEGTGYRVGGIGYTVSGEVSTTCDDLEDNFFLDDMTRFPEIEENAVPIRLLCHEYTPARTRPLAVAGR